MDTTDTLQIKIDKARDEMSPLSRGAIDAVNWIEIIFSMNTKYNAEQLENLKIETELLLCGLTSTVDFPKELETRMKIPRSEVALLLDQMDKLIFKKMQEKLEEKLNENNPNSSAFPKVNVTSKPVVPLPPYVISNKQNVVSSMDEKTKQNIHEDMYREHGIEIISNKYTQETPTIEKPQEQIQNKEEKINTNSNIIANKLFSNTASQKVVTDYSIPAINTKKQDFSSIQGVAPSKPHDPYHEEI